MNLSPIRPPEADLSPTGAFNLKTLFVHEAMVVAAEMDEVLELGRTAFRPVVDVVGVQVPGERSTIRSEPSVLATTCTTSSTGSPPWRSASGAASAVRATVVRASARR